MMFGLKEKLTTAEKISAALSVLALIASLLSLYFQFFYTSQKLELTVTDVFGGDDNLRVSAAIVNRGNQTALVASVELCAFPDAQLHRTVGTKSDFSRRIPTGDTLAKSFPILIRPGDIVPFQAIASHVVRELDQSNQSEDPAKRQVKVGFLVHSVDSTGNHFGGKVMPITVGFVGTRIAWATANVKAQELFSFSIVEWP